MTAAFDYNLYSSNLDLLKTRIPDLYRQVNRAGDGLPFVIEVVRTSAGQANVIATANDGGRIAFYQEQDILTEIEEKISSWQLEREDFLFCVGLGLGYLPLVAARAFASRPRIVIIEPCLEIVRLAMQTVDLRELFADSRLDLHVGPELKVADIIGQYGERVFFGNNRLVSHGPSRLLFGDAFKSLEAEVIENIHVVRNIGFTAKHGGAQIFNNTMDNLSSLLDGPDLATLAGRFAGCPAVCVAAGPSLDKDLCVLKTIGNRALIISGDSAVRSLVEAGIRPHIVVTTDMNPINFEKMRTSMHCLDKAVLVFSIEANPDSVGSFPGKRKIAVTAHNAVLNDWLGPSWSMDWSIPAMTSVSHTALFTAIGLGAGPIILVGMDFAYSEGKSHASGSVFRYPVNPDKLIEVQGVGGLTVYSLPQLSTDRKQIENVMAKSPVRFIDSSLDGALIRGAENRCLQEVADTMLADNTDAAAMLETIDWQSKADRQMAANQYMAMRRQMDRFLEECNRRQAQLLAAGHPSRQVRAATDLRSELADFERSHAVVVSILKILRYGDIKQTVVQLSKLETDPAGNGQSAVELYADIYASLHRAGTIFKEKLQWATDFLVKRNDLWPPSSQDSEAKDGPLKLADHYLRFGCTAKAALTLIDHLRENNDNLKAWLKLVGIFVEKQIWALADRYAKQMQRHCPSDPRVGELATTIDAAIGKLLDDAEVSMGAGSVDGARRKLFEYHSLRKTDERSRNIQHRIDGADRKNEQAMTGLAAPHLAWEQIVTLHRRIKECLRSQAVEEAVGICEGLTRVGGQEEWKAREAIGDIRLSQKDGAGAAWHYKMALAQSPGNKLLEKKLEQAAGMDTDGNHSPTEVPFMKPEEILEPAADNRSRQELYQLAQQMVQAGEIADAITTLKELVEVHPDFALAHNDLAVLLYNRGDTEQSIWHYREAVRIEPENTVFQKNLADFLYFVNGDAQQALAIYVSLLKKNPEDKEVLLALGQICVSQGQDSDAALFYRRVLGLEPENADAHMGLAQLPAEITAGNDEQGGEGGERISAEPPSAIIETEVALGGRRHRVQIPEQETFRIQHIFGQNEYGILDRRRHQGVFTVFDVGANVGLFALRTLMEHPKCRIHCFEPSPLAQQLLAINVGQFEETVIHNQGLFNRDMQTDLHINRYNTGQNSIRFTGRHQGQTVTIELKDAGARFDELDLEYLDVLKIDTEGCEVEILKSMGDRLERVDYVLLEYHTEQDRRIIDQLLTMFHLFGAHSKIPGVGTVKYMHPSLV